MIRDISVDLPGTATRTVPAFRAIRPGRLIAASYAQELDADGTKNIKIRNATRAVDMTAALDVAALAALAGAAMVVNTDGSADYTIGDLIVFVYTVTVAGASGAGAVTVGMDINEGPAYVGGGIGG